MRIMAILGSPRRQGNTAKVLGWIEEQFRADGHEVDSASILDYRVQGCGECMACKGAPSNCAASATMPTLFRRMAAADMVVVAAPVFCWGFPAQVKGLIDRMLCMMDFDGERAGVPRLHGKGMAVLHRRRRGSGQRGPGRRRVSAARPVAQGKNGGHWFMGGCTTPEEIGDDMKTRAVELPRR